MDTTVEIAEVDIHFQMASYTNEYCGIQVNFSEQTRDNVSHFFPTRVSKHTFLRLNSSHFRHIKAI